MGFLKKRLPYLLAVSYCALTQTGCYSMMSATTDAAVLASQNQLSADSQDPQAPGNSTAITDTIYLKDGSIIHGKIIEETPETSLKIQTSSGNVFTYQMSDVEKITHRRMNAQ